MALFASILLSVIVAWMLVRPHLEVAEGPTAVTGVGSLEILLDQKARCAQLLKDLELDFSTGKLSEGDYARMRGSLSNELGLLLARIDECRGAQ